MWIRDGAGYFFGPIFIHPEETEHEPTKMFYKKEVFLSNLEEACPMTCIIGSLNFPHDPHSAEKMKKIFARVLFLFFCREMYRVVLQRIPVMSANGSPRRGCPAL